MKCSKPQTNKETIDVLRKSWQCKHISQKANVTWTLIVNIVRGFLSILELFVKYTRWNHGLSPKPWVHENQHKVTQVFLLVKLPYTKSGVELLNNWLSSLSYQDAWAKLALHRLIQKFRTTCPMHIPYLRSWNSLKVSEVGRRGPKSSIQLSNWTPIDDKLMSSF